MMAPKLTYKERFRSVNQGLNNKGGCCEVRAQILPIIPSLAAVYWLLMRYANVTTSKNKKIAKNSTFIENGCIIYQSIQNFI